MAGCEEVGGGETRASIKASATRFASVGPSRLVRGKSRLSGHGAEVPAAARVMTVAASPDPSRVVMTTTDSNAWGGNSGHTYTLTRRSDGGTDVDAVVVRDGKNFKGHFLGVVLGSVGKSRLTKAFHNSVQAVEVQNHLTKVAQS